jgi:hypothetical protein
MSHDLEVHNCETCGACLDLCLFCLNNDLWKPITLKPYKEPICKQVRDK